MTVRVNRTPAHAGGLIGYIDVNYERLVDAFDEPLPGSEWKVKAQWSLTTPAGEAHIYDWKRDGEPIDCTRWHVGGRSNRAIVHVAEALGLSSFIMDFMGSGRTIIHIGSPEERALLLLG